MSGSLFLAVLIALLYLFTYYTFGFLVFRVAHAEDEVSPLEFLPVGMFAQAVVCFCTVMFPKWKVLPLDTICKLWIVVWAACVAIALLANGKAYLASLHRLAKDLGADWRTVVPAAAIVAGQIAFTEIYGRILGGENHTYYIGYVTGALHDGYLGITEARIGTDLSKFMFNYFLQTFLDHSAIVCRLTGLHPLLEIRTVLPALMLLVTGILLLLLAREFFPESPLQRVIFIIVFISVGNVMARSVLMPSFYEYFRAFEGKNVLGTILLPMSILYLWRMYDSPRRLLWPMCLFLAVSGSIMYTMSTLFSFPFLVIAMLPMVFQKQFGYALRNLVIVSIPCLITAVYYFAYLSGRLTLPIQR